MWSGNAELDGLEGQIFSGLAIFSTDIRVVGKPTEDLYLPLLLYLFPAIVLESSFSSISWFYSPVTVLAQQSPSHSFSATLITSFQFWKLHLMLLVSHSAEDKSGLKPKVPLWFKVIFWKFFDGRFFHTVLVKSEYIRQRKCPPGQSSPQAGMYISAYGFSCRVIWELLWEKYSACSTLDFKSACF